MYKVVVFQYGIDRVIEIYINNVSKGHVWLTVGGVSTYAVGYTRLQRVLHKLYV